MTRRNLISVFFIALLLFVFYNTALILSPFFRPIFWSAAIAFGFYPLYLRISGLLKTKGAVSAAITTLVIFLLFLPIIGFLAISVARETISLYHWLSEFIRSGGAEDLLDRLQSLSFIQKFKESDLFQWDFFHDNFKKWILSSANTLGGFALRQVAVFSRNLFIGTINFFLMLFLVFFFLRDGEKVYEFIYKITPLEEHTKTAVFKQLSDTFSAVLRGQLLTAIVQASVAGIIFWALGLPLPLFFAALTFMTALIPVIGAATVWVPFVIYLSANQLYTKAIILLLLGIFGISLVDNFLKPLLIGEKTKLPYLLLFLGILGGMQVYGLMGIFLAPTVLSLFFVLIKIYRERFAGAEDHSRIF